MAVAVAEAEAVTTTGLHTSFSTIDVVHTQQTCIQIHFLDHTNELEDLHKWHCIKINQLYRYRYRVAYLKRSNW